MNRIKPGVTEDDLLVILTDVVDTKGFFDAVDLLDRLERIKSPLAIINRKTGDRKLDPCIIKELRKNFKIEYDKYDKHYYKR